MQNMNKKIIIGVDQGYGNMKTAHRVFQTGVEVMEEEPIVTTNFVKYKEKYYVTDKFGVGICMKEIQKELSKERGEENPEIEELHGFSGQTRGYISFRYLCKRKRI